MEDFEQDFFSDNQSDNLSLLEQIVTPMWVYDVGNHRICWANQSALALWNATNKQQLYQRDLGSDITEVSDRQLKQLAADCRVKHCSMWWTLYPNNQPKEVYLRFKNISQSEDRNYLLCESVLSRQEAELDTSFVTGAFITSMFDRDGQYISANLNFTNKYDPQDIDLHELLEMGLPDLLLLMDGGDTISFERQVITGGRICWFQFKIKRLMPEQNYLVVQEDISLRKTREQTYRHLAYHDQLTGLLNRYGLNDYLVERCKSQDAFHLFLVDLDAFKLVNNNLGHSTGDEVLVVIARRLLNQLSDTYQVCRFGGDEFIIIVPAQRDSQSIEAVGQIILDVIARPIDSIDSIQITASIGAASFPSDAHEPTSLIMYADTAMYKAKEQGSESYCSFALQMSLELQRRSALQQGLKQALVFDELVPLYQPIVNMKTNTLVGMEALLSWESPSLGKVSPQEFVPEAERSGMMNEIGQWILESACRQCLKWQRLSNVPLKLSVNVSAIQLNDKFINTLDEILVNTGFPANCLTLELTESIFLLNIKEVIKRLKAISARGVSICIDDFGTGYSSLSYIHKLPIDALKIDRSFISDIDSSDVVIEATIAMATKLGLNVVAEGIENQHQREMMLRYPNLLAQGYFYSRPVNKDDFEKLSLFTKLLPKDGEQKIINFLPK
ncbi:MAG: EAL domain-containing protein [Psychrobium sp.]|nr:EAL domain-containing protein [Psychrobium sp.]